MIFYNVEDLVEFTQVSKGKIGFTSGCYDIPHSLHVEFLNNCGRECKYLIVFIDSDRLIYRNKGQYPVMTQNDRAFIISNLKSVYAVCIFNDLDEMKKAIVTISHQDSARLIDVYKNSDKIYGQDLIKYGSLVNNVIIPDIQRFQSSTDIKNFLKQQVNEKLDINH